MANPGTRVDALPAFHFEVDIGGTSYPFRSCTGLSSETKVFEVEEGGVNGYVHKLVGPTTFPNLVLRQGFCNPASPLYALYQKMIADGGAKKRFDGFVRQIGPNGTSAKWVFKQGWIAKWTGPELDATKNEVSIESIEIVHEGLQLVGSGSSSASASSSSPVGGSFSILGQQISPTNPTGATPPPLVPPPSSAASSTATPSSSTSSPATSGTSTGDITPDGAGDSVMSPQTFDV